MGNPHAIFMHCSGVLPLDILPFRRKAIFYPLQTFSAKHQVNWKSTPILLTTDDPQTHAVVSDLAKSISDHIYTIRDRDKAALHLAAVFANNFTNHMLTLAESICKGQGLDFDMLKPLIRETFEKACIEGPIRSQTGPAIRGDDTTIQKHISMLAQDPHLTRIYKIITESIQRMSAQD
jgi:predicted short-subunit dehydrogenase-like oxidoreductase (DUF2520 family)